MARCYPWEKAALGAAPPVIGDGDAELPGFVGEIAGDAGAWENDDADGQDVEHAVVALEGCGWRQAVMSRKGTKIGGLCPHAPQGGKKSSYCFLPFPGFVSLPLREVNPAKLDGEEPDRVTQFVLAANLPIELDARFQKLLRMRYVMVIR